MGKSSTIGAIVVRRQVRTCRFDGYVPRDQEPYIDVYREAVLLDDSGEPISGVTVSATRVMWGSLKSKSWTLSTGTTVTAQEMYEALSRAFDEATDG